MTGKGPSRPGGWKPGDVANGHILGPDNVWRPLVAPHRPWRPGDMANGHVLGHDNVWRPVQPVRTQAGPLVREQPGPARGTPAGGPPPWYKRPWGLIGIVIGSLFLLGGIGNALDGSGNPDTEKASDTADDGSRRSNQAADDGPDETPESEAAATPSPTSKPTPQPTPKPKPKPPTYLVVDVVDGDTIELGNGQTVRIVGIDTPERGQCGYEKASDNMARLVLGKRVRLAESDEDTDRYGRLLRYVDVGRVDAGLAQIKHGLAIARYDSRDGYGFHPREPLYIKADGGSKQISCPKPKPKPQPLVGSGGGGDCMTGYSPCLPIVGDLDCGDINGPVQVTGDDPYRLDADGDGTGCDS